MREPLDDVMIAAMKTTDRDPTTRLRAALAITLTMNVVLASLVLGARLPSGDVVGRSPGGFALDYEGAPPASFAELVATSALPDPIAGGSSQPGFAVRPDRRPQDPTCRDELLEGPRCEGPEGGSQSVEYIASPGPYLTGERAPFAVRSQIFRTPTQVLSILVEDESGAGVPVIVSQGGDIVVEFCSRGDAFDLSSFGFKPGYFSATVETANERCPTVGTKGRITITW